MPDPINMPISEPKAGFNESVKFFLLIISPAIAPMNDPRNIPIGPIIIKPVIKPIEAPINPPFEPPSFLTPIIGII